MDDTKGLKELSINKLILEPFPDKGVETGTHGGGTFKVSRLENDKSSLVSLKVLKTAIVLFNSKSVTVAKGSRVWVRRNEYSAPYGKEVFTVGDESFIIFPADRVEFFSLLVN